MLWLTGLQNNISAKIPHALHSRGLYGWLPDKGRGLATETLEVGSSDQPMYVIVDVN